MIFKYFSSLLIIAILLSSCNKKIKDGGSATSIKEHITSIDLNGKSIDLPSEILIEKNSGFSNGTVKGNNTRIKSEYRQIFKNVKLDGKWQNDTFPLAWFVSGHNAEENFLALLEILRMNKVVLLDKMYPITTTGSGPSKLNIKDVDIVGIKQGSCGLTLETHFSNNNAYFNSHQGSNIRLVNLTINTSESIKGIYKNSNRYVLASSYHNSQSIESNPNFKSVYVDNCHIKGNVMIRYNGNIQDQDLSNKGIKSIEIINNKFSHTGDFFTLSNAVYENVVIKGNIIENITGITFCFPISGQGFDHALISKKRKTLFFENNIVANDIAITIPGITYLSPIIAKGRDFIVKNNRIENILSLNPQVAAYGFYCSASNHLLVENNYIKNCGGISTVDKVHSSSLLKLKGAENATIRNNEFHFDRQGLELLGLLRNKQKLSDIDPRYWKLCIFDHWKLPSLDSSSFLILENNIFKSVVLSDYSHMFNAKITMIKNKFEIDYFMDTPIKNWDNQGVRLPFTFFYFRNPIKDGIFDFNGNTVIIKESAGGPFYLTVNRDDNKSFKNISYSNNTFDINENMGIDINRTKDFIAENKTIGRGSLFFSHPSTLSKNNFVQNQKISQTAESLTNDYHGLLNIRAHGSLGLKIKKPINDQMTLMNIKLPDFYYYEERDSLPVSLHLKLSYIRGSRKYNHVYHVIVDRDNTSYFIGTNGNQSNSKMVWSENHNQPHFKNEIGAIKSNSPRDIGLFWSSKAANFSSHHNGFLIIEGLNGVTNLEIESIVSPTAIRNRTNTLMIQSMSAQTILK